MKEYVTSNISLRLLNQNRILNLLYNEGSLTQSEIKEKSGLSGPTVNSALQLYKEAGIFICGEALASSGGRKPMLLAFNYDYRYAIGLEIRKHHVDISIINLKGSCLAFKSIRKVFAMTDDYLKEVNGLVKELVKENGIAEERLLGIAMAFPGEISLSGDEITRATVLNIHNVPLSSFREAFDYPLLIEYGPNAAGFGAVFRDKSIDDAVYVVITDNGIAGSVVIDKKIYRGRTGKAGAFGHIALDPNGRICDCGRRGCWSACCALNVLTNNDEIKLKDFFAKVDEGDSKAKGLLDKYLHDLSSGLIDVRLAYDTDIIIGGKIAPYLCNYLDTIKEYVFSYPVLKDDEFEISLDMSSSSPMSLGAALMLADDFLKRN